MEESKCCPPRTGLHIFFGALATALIVAGFCGGWTCGWQGHYQFVMANSQYEDGARCFDPERVK